MERHFFLFIVMTIVFVAMFTSCEKDDNGTVLLLEKIQYSNGEQLMFEYDNQKRIKKRTDYNYAGQVACVYTYTYNIGGDLVELKWEDPQDSQNNNKTTYYKEGNKIIYDHIFGSGKHEIEMNAQGLPVEYTFVYYRVDFSGADWRTCTGTFTSQNGNLTKIEWDEDAREFGVEGRIVSIGTYTFDDKKSPFYNCKTPKWYFWMHFRSYYNENNIITETWDYIPPIFSFFAPTNEYTYNDDGFPITLKMSYPDGFSATETYTYKKK